jgi:6-phosphogluconolactonase
MNRFCPTNFAVNPILNLIVNSTACLPILFALAASVAASVSGGVVLGQETQAAGKSPQRLRVYIGTYTGEKSKGIYLSQLDLATGELSAAQVAAEVAQPSFLALHPNGKWLYSVNETSDAAGRKSGAVSAFAIDRGTGKLTFLNEQSSAGAGPCHLVVDREGKNVLVANYGGGSVASLPIGADGKLEKASSSIQHVGSSVNKQRQEGPHAHSINLDLAGKFAFAADLGLDKVLVYRFDSKAGKLEANDPPAAAVAPGAGPRHFAFHPKGGSAYVINEIGNTVTAFKYDAARGTLAEIQTIGTLPDDFKGTSHTAEVVAHPSGKFLYGSNRGHDSIAIFSIDAATGKLTKGGWQSTGGKTPRNFAIDPTGAYLLAENQGSDTIVVFRIDQQTGALKPTGHSLGVPSPVCVRMAAP